MDSEHCRARERLVQTLVGVQDASMAGGPCTRAAAGRAGGAGRTQDSPSSPPTGSERRDLRLRTRRRLPGTGLRYTRRGQAEDQAKAIWRTRTGAIGGGSATQRQRARAVLSDCMSPALPTRPRHGPMASWLVASTVSPSAPPFLVNPCLPGALRRRKSPSFTSCNASMPGISTWWTVRRIVIIWRASELSCGAVSDSYVPWLGPCRSNTPGTVEGV
jgi:hypothetical protein